MNYVDNRCPPACVSCGAVIDYEPEDAFACNPCFFESERKAAEEAVRDFRWAAKNWICCDGCRGTGIRKDQHCFCRKGNALHAEAAAQFAFVRGLPALAVCGERHMRENDIDPQMRIAK